MILIEGLSISGICEKFEEEGIYVKNYQIRRIVKNNNITTIKGILNYIECGERRNAKLYDVILPDGTEASLSSKQVLMIHPYKDEISIGTIRNRLNKNNKNLWSPKLSGGATPKKTESVIKKKLPINRLKCCLRDKGRQKCKTYALRLQMDDGVPEPCLEANGDYCPNYDGTDIKVTLDSSGRGVRHYGPNGTNMCLR